MILVLILFPYYYYYYYYNNSGLKLERHVQLFGIWKSFNKEGLLIVNFLFDCGLIEMSSF